MKAVDVWIWSAMGVGVVVIFVLGSGGFAVLVVALSDKLFEWMEERIEKVEFRKMGERTTVYLVTLKNGYEITGYSAVWDLSLYDKDKGRYWAFRRAVEKFPALKEKGYVG